jgi:hypothetical protein
MNVIVSMRQSVVKLWAKTHWAYMADEVAIEEIQMLIKNSCINIAYWKSE